MTLKTLKLWTSFLDDSFIVQKLSNCNEQKLARCMKNVPNALSLNASTFYLFMQTNYQLLFLFQSWFAFFNSFLFHWRFFSCKTALFDFCTCWKKNSSKSKWAKFRNWFKTHLKVINAQPKCPIYHFGDVSVEDNIQFGISNYILFLHNKIYFWNIHINLICICIISSSLRTKILENFCEMEIKEKILFYIFHMTRAVFSKMHTQQLKL